MLSLALALMTTVKADVLLRVRPHVVVSAATEVRLSQLVDTEALSPASRARLEAVPLFTVQGRREVSSAELMPRLREIVAIERAAGKVHVVVPSLVVIDTKKRELDRETIAAELKQAWQPLCADCRLSVEDLSLPRVERVRDWSLRIKPELPRGSFSVAVDLIRENGAPLPAWISGRVIAKRRVPVARRALAALERVQPGDVDWDYRDTSASYDGVPTADEMLGRRVRQGVRAGDVLFSGLLEKERAVRRGEVVQLRSVEKGWEVSMAAVVQQDGFIGDMINLKSARSGQTLMGQVTGIGEVELR